MKIIFLTLILLSLILKAYAQDDCCSKEYTHRQIGISSNPTIAINLLDSLKFSTPPLLRDSIRFIDSIQTAIIKEYEDNPSHFLRPIRANISGQLVFWIKINDKGLIDSSKLTNITFTDPFAYEKVRKSALKFEPATLNGEKKECEIIFQIDYNLKGLYDAPEKLIDEIKIEYKSGQIYFEESVTFRNDGTAEYVQYKVGEATIDTNIMHGKLDRGIFSKINDFVFAQCFFDYEDGYIGQTWDVPKTIVTVTMGDTKKLISSRGKGYEPINFWVLQNLLWKIKNDVFK